MTLAEERRAARERALGLLYEAEAKAVAGADVLAELPLAPDEFAEALVRAVDEHRVQIDALLSRFAEGWTLERMAALDRAALRMGTAELLTRPDVPTGVVLAETVDLASRFSTDGSGRFVNGLLARIAQEVRGDQPSPATPTPSEPVDIVREEPGTMSTGSRGRPQVDGVIVDLDGVIRHWHASHVPDAENRLGLPPGTIAAVAFEDDRLARAMDGRLSFEGWCAEIGATVAADHPVDADEVAQVFVDAGWDIDLDMVDLLAEVRQTVPVALLSNATTQLRGDLERSGIADAFDAIVGSADVRAAKPSRAAFEAAATGLDVELERCFFVDDTVSHVEAARSYGLRAEVFTGLDDLHEVLTELGVLG